MGYFDDDFNDDIDNYSETYSLDMIKNSEVDEKTNFKINYKDELNEAQYEAVMFTDGPALVLAGAGTGKTRVVVYRVTRLVESGVNPESILLLTFTRKAAKEMTARASQLLDGRCNKISGGTYHSFAVNILKRYGEAIGLKKNFTILDSSDAESAINLTRAKVGIDKSDKRFPKSGTLMSIFSLSVNTCKDIDYIVKQGYPQYISNIEKIENCYQAYKEFKKEKQVFDYDDLLVYLLELLTTKPEIASKLSEHYRYVMVDEYQDSNLLQLGILKALCDVEIEDMWCPGYTEKRCNLMVVGDPNQSIYAFRGAHYKNIVDFPKHFEGCKIIALNENYRSVQSVLDLSNAIMKNTNDGLYNPLKSRKQSRAKPMLVNTPSENAQSLFVVQRILELREKNVSLNDIAVLFRNGHHSSDLEAMLSKYNIPYKKFGGKKFLESSHIKDLVALLKVISNPLDILAWYRIFSIYKNIGLGAKNMALVANKATADESYMFLLDEAYAKAKYKDILADLQSILASTRALPFEEQVQVLAEYYIPLMKEKYPDDNYREDDIKTLISVASQYTSADDFLAEVILDPPESTEALPEDDEDEFLTLSTIHSAKGLEWRVVFMTSCVDGYIPASKSIGKADEEDEERRLFYTAVTRAKQLLYIIKPNFIPSYSSNGTPQLTKFVRTNYAARNLCRLIKVT